MPSSFTPTLGIEKPATGEQTAVWGNTVNVNMELVEQAVTGAAVLSLPATGSTGTPNTLVMSQGGVATARNVHLTITDGGDLGGSAFLRMDPNTVRKIGYFRNALSGGQTLVLFQGTYDVSRALEVANGQTVLVLFQGNGVTSTVTNLLTGMTLPTLTVLGAATINGTSVPASSTLATTLATQTLENKTVKDVLFQGGYTEQVSTISDGPAVNLAPSAGTVQIWTLSADRSPTATGFNDGQSMLLLINDGAGFTITWPSVTWLGGVAPPLSPTGFTFIRLSKIASVIYGDYAGAAP